MTALPNSPRSSMQRCSESTMLRILRDRGLARTRSGQHLDEMCADPENTVRGYTGVWEGPALGHLERVLGRLFNVGFVPEGGHLQ